MVKIRMQSSLYLAGFPSLSSVCLGQDISLPLFFIIVRSFAHPSSPHNSLCSIFSLGCLSFVTSFCGLFSGKKGRSLENLSIYGSLPQDESGRRLEGQRKEHLYESTMAFWFVNVG